MLLNINGQCQTREERNLPWVQNTPFPLPILYFCSVNSWLSVLKKERISADNIIDIYPGMYFPHQNLEISNDILLKLFIIVIYCSIKKS